VLSVVYIRASSHSELPVVFLRYTVFVLQLPAYLPVYLAPEKYERASAEFSITLYLVNLPEPVKAVFLSVKAMALDKGNNDNLHAFILFSRYREYHYTQKHYRCKLIVIFLTVR